MAASIAGSTSVLLTEQLVATTKVHSLNTSALKGLSVTNIVLWVVTTTLHSVIITAFSGGLNGSYYVYFDVVAWGIWGGLLFGVAGFLGIATSYEKKRSLTVATLVFAVLSICASIIGAVFSGVMAAEARGQAVYVDSVDSDTLTAAPCMCDKPSVGRVWSILEWALMGFCIVALGINIAVTAIISKSVCGCCSVEATSSTSGGKKHSEEVQSIENAIQSKLIPLQAAYLEQEKVIRQLQEQLKRFTPPLLSKEQRQALEISFSSE